MRALRIKLKMSQRQLAARAGVPQPDLAQIERCARDLNVDTLARLLDALYCDLVLVPRPRRDLGDLLWQKTQEWRPKRSLAWVDPTTKVWKG